MEEILTGGRSIPRSDRGMRSPDSFAYSLTKTDSESLAESNCHSYTGKV